jgi:hypothetical protein
LLRAYLGRVHAVLEASMPDSTRAKNDSAQRPPFGMQRPAFGLTKEASHRIELQFALKSGGTLNVTHDVGAEISEESFERFVKELQEQVVSGKGVVTFADGWSDSGARAWIDLAEVAAFSARPTR